MSYTSKEVAVVPHSHTGRRKEKPTVKEKGRLYMFKYLIMAYIFKESPLEDIYLYIRKKVQPHMREKFNPGSRLRHSRPITA